MVECLEFLLDLSHDGLLGERVILLLVLLHHLDGELPPEMNVISFLVSVWVLHFNCKLLAVTGGVIFNVWMIEVIVLFRDFLVAFLEHLSMIENILAKLDASLERVLSFWLFFVCI